MLWGVIGGALGFAALLEQQSALKEEMPQKPWDALVFAVMVPGMAMGLGAIGYQVGAEVQRGKAGASTYWTAMIGISAVVYPLLSSGNVGDLISKIG
ncbi:hypothetical protein [Streptomyces sp. NPDC047725]|uniref:hypothetical protein n=1 Tax=Streptomyces sp. NPDC047725 TaxID=3365487 RepID=UPI0037104052